MDPFCHYVATSFMQSALQKQLQRSKLHSDCMQDLWPLLAPESDVGSGKNAKMKHIYMAHSPEPAGEETQEHRLRSSYSTPWGGVWFGWAATKISGCHYKWSSVEIANQEKISARACSRTKKKKQKKKETSNAKFQDLQDMNHKTMLLLYCSLTFTICVFWMGC